MSRAELRALGVAIEAGRHARKPQQACGCGAFYDLSANQCPGCASSSNVAVAVFSTNIPAAGPRHPEQARMVARVGGLP